MMFYAFGSAAIGSFLLTTANGSRAAASAQAGLMNWTDYLSDDAKAAIISRWYGNTPEAVEKFKHASDENMQKALAMFPSDSSQFKAENFTTDGFLVRSAKLFTRRCCAHAI